MHYARQRRTTTEAPTKRRNEVSGLNAPDSQPLSLPDAPARALLRAIEREPETMRRLLGQAA